MRVRITIEDGTLVFDSKLDRFPFRIGRKSPSEVVISASGVSSQHVEIFRDEKGGFFLRDMGSRNGTYLNEEKLSVVPIAFPFSFTLGKKVKVDLIDEDAIQPTPATFIVDSKTARIANLSKRKELVAKMKKTLPFEQRFYAPDLSNTLLGKFQSLPLSTVLVEWMAFVLLGVVLNWIFTRDVIYRLLAQSIVDSTSIFLFSISVCLPLSLIYLVLKNGWIFRGPLIGVFFVTSTLKIYFEYFYPFLVSELFGVIVFLFSVSLFLVVSAFLYSLLFRGLLPKLSFFYFQALVVIFSLATGVLTGGFLWEKRQGGAYVDLFKRTEAPSRVLAGIAVSPQQFKLEMKRLNAEKSTYRHESAQE